MSEASWFGSAPSYLTGVLPSGDTEESEGVLSAGASLAGSSLDSAEGCVEFGLSEDWEVEALGLDGETAGFLAK